MASAAAVHDLPEYTLISLTFLYISCRCACPPSSMRAALMSSTQRTFPTVWICAILSPSILELFTSFFIWLVCRSSGVSLSKSLLRISFSEFSPATRRLQMAAKTSISTLISRIITPPFFHAMPLASPQQYIELFTSCKEGFRTFLANPLPVMPGLVPGIQRRQAHKSMKDWANSLIRKCAEALPQYGLSYGTSAAPSHRSSICP